MTPPDTHLCPSCNSNQVAKIIDFGLQPVCNRFPASATEEESCFPLGLSLCRSCGLVTLSQPAPVEELRPRVDWIAYREAEGHLDDLVKNIIATAGIASNDMILGLSYKDTSVLERLSKSGYKSCRQIALHADLGIEQPEAGIETLQDAITTKWAGSFSSRHGQAKLVIARHILEHTHDIQTFLEAICNLVQPGGWVVFEVPDFSVAMEHCDYSSIWEEHTFYFTPETLQGLLPRYGFEVKHFGIYPYSLENSLVVICQLNKPAIESPEAKDSREQVSRAENYAANFPRCRDEIRAGLKRLNSTGKIAIFGAGHLAAKYINLLGISGYISCVIDDDPHKCGRYMPGSRLAIKPSAALVEEGIKWCLFSLNPESEEKVLKKLKPLFESAGVETYSIFQTSPKKLPLQP